MIYDIMNKFQNEPFKIYFIITGAGCGLIYDCFSYFNEIELLKHLSAVVLVPAQM